jgi:lipopolysaccharide transport system permease protein
MKALTKYLICLRHKIQDAISPFNPVGIVRHLWKYKDLIRHMARREVLVIYRGTFGGLAWSIINPLLMLGIYTFVFGVIFRARWDNSPDDNRAVFALTLFLGLITFMIFAEVINAAPTLILRNVNYVKKVVFPLEILPIITLISSLVNGLLSLIPLLLGLLLLRQPIHLTMLLLPLVWLPLVLLTLGGAYFLASLGVFVRDLAAAVTVITTMLRFICPIFYPISRVPENLRIFMQVNPLSIIVEDARRVFLWGQWPDWKWFFFSFAISFAIWVLGFFWFMRTKKAFADVV